MGILVEQNLFSAIIVNIHRIHSILLITAEPNMMDIGAAGKPQGISPLSHPTLKVPVHVSSLIEFFIKKPLPKAFFVCKKIPADKTPSGEKGRNRYIS